LSQNYIVNYYTYKLDSILKKCLFIHSVKDILPLKLKNTFYINRSIPTTYNYLVERGDVIELLLAVNYLLYNMQFIYIYRKNSFKYSFKARNLFNYKEDSRISKHLFNYNYKFLVNFVLDFEIDYYSGTIIVINKKYNSNSYTLKKNNHLSYYQASLYNWGWEV